MFCAGLALGIFISIFMSCVSLTYFRPRLGTTLHKVLAVGLVYFIASATEGCLRAIRVSISHFSGDGCDSGVSSDDEGESIVLYCIQSCI